MGPSESILIHHLTFILLAFTFTREAWINFNAGQNCDGYFNADDLLQQVDKAIDIFEGLTNGWAQELFLFGNVPSHQKRALNAISARNMVKGAPHFPLSLLPPWSMIRWCRCTAVDVQSPCDRFLFLSGTCCLTDFFAGLKE
jgi:hypothetical protein